MHGLLASGRGEAIDGHFGARELHVIVVRICLVCGRRCGWRHLGLLGVHLWSLELSRLVHRHALGVRHFGKRNRQLALGILRQHKPAVCVPAVARHKKLFAVAESGRLHRGASAQPSGRRHGVGCNVGYQSIKLLLGALKVCGSGEWGRCDFLHAADTARLAGNLLLNLLNAPWQAAQLGLQAAQAGACELLIAHGDGQVGRVLQRGPGCRHGLAAIGAHGHVDVFHPHVVLQALLHGVLGRDVAARLADHDGDLTLVVEAL